MLSKRGRLKAMEGRVDKSQGRRSWYRSPSSRFEWSGTRYHVFVFVVVNSSCSHVSRAQSLSFTLGRGFFFPYYRVPMLVSLHRACVIMPEAEIDQKRPPPSSVGDYRPR